LLTKLSFGKKISSATFSDPLGEVSVKTKLKLIYFSCIGIVVGAFEFKFKGIPGVISFESEVPTFLIGGLLGIVIAYLFALYSFYLWDDFLKWKNDIVVTSTNAHWGVLLRIRDACIDANNQLTVISSRIKELESRVFFSAEFLEKEDKYLKERLGGGYGNLVNYIRGVKGVQLKEFRQESQPFCCRLGKEGANYLLERIVRTDISDDTNIYATYYYLKSVVDSDVAQYSERIIDLSTRAEVEFSRSLNKFQLHNLGLSANQVLKLVIIEVGVPFVLSCASMVLLLPNSMSVVVGIYEKLISKVT